MSFKPPRLAEAIIRSVLPPADAETTCGDFEEAAARMAVRQGPGAARRWYWRQAASLAMATIAERRRHTGNATRGGGLIRDIRHAARLLGRQPAFTAAAVLTLALGIGASAAVVAVVDAVLRRPLGYAGGERLVAVRETHEGIPGGGLASYPDYLDWTAATSLEEVAGHNGGTVTLSGEGPVERIPIVEVTPNFFATLGVRPAIGRDFDASDATGDLPRAMLVSDGFWRSRFGADPEVLGRVVRLNGAPVAIVGVLPSAFEFPLRGAVDVWLPLIPSQAQRERRSFHWLDVIARLRPGVPKSQARDELLAIIAGVRQEDPRWHGTAGIAVEPLRERMVGEVRLPLLVLLGATALVLLIAAANVANLLLARAASRDGEIRLRLALGATRGRVYRQLMTEALLLSAAGGLAGMLVARWMLGVLVSGIPERQLASMPHLLTLAFDWRIVSIALLLSALTALLFGTVPARRAMRADAALSAGPGARAIGSRSASRSGGAVVVAEIAIAVVLLSGATLLARSFHQLMQASPGFTTEGLLTFRVTLPPRPYDTPERLGAAHRELLERFSRIPGIRQVATINQPPLTGRGNTGAFAIVGRQGAGADDTSAMLRTISRQYVAAQRLRLVAGRLFERTDATGPRVVLVNESLARAVFPQGDAVGQRIEFTAFLAGIHFEIVGVISDEQYSELGQPMAPVVYFSYEQSPERGFTVVARTEGRAEPLVPALRAELEQFDATLPMFAVRSMESIVSDSRPVFLRRYLMFVIGAFAWIAVALAAVGVYGVIAYSVAERVREFGIRQALGATRGDVMRLVLGRGLRLTLGGVALGVLGAWAASRALESLLFGVAASDPFTFALVPAVLLAVSLAACWIPARRALRIDPASALRE